MKSYSNILIDILTPKQALFFCKLEERLQDKGYNVYLTSRNYDETTQILERNNKNVKIIGEYGKTLQEKLLNSLDRTRELAKFELDLGIDLAISFSSVEAARSSFGLSIPHFCVSDSPHASAVSRLSLPISDKLFAPSIIPKKEWLQYGIESNKITTYDAIDPIVWIKDAKPNQKDLTFLNLNPNKNIITVRLEETYASYLLDSDSMKYSITFEVIDHLLNEKPDMQIVVLPRYKEQTNLLRQKFSDRIIVPTSLVYAPSLLLVSEFFIGGGGTMTAEAALLGIPTISCFPGGSTYVEQFLSKNGLLKRIMDAEKILTWISEVLAGKISKKKLRQGAKNLMDKMEDPLEVIIRGLESNN